MADRVDLTAVEQMHVDGASAYFTTVCESCGYQWPCTTSRLAEALRIAREAHEQPRAALQHIANQGRLRPQDTGFCAVDLAEYAADALSVLDYVLARIDALVDFGGES